MSTVNMKKLKNLTQYNFTATFIKADVTVRERKSSSLEYIYPTVLLKNVYLVDTGELIAKYYWLGYGKSLAKLRKLTSGTQLNFEARPDTNVLGNKNNADIASLITWPKKFQRLDKTYQYQAIPENENQLVGYILSNKKQEYNENEQWYLDQYKLWREENGDELDTIVEDIEVEDILDDKLEKYAAVKSDELSDSENRKYVIIDRKTKKILDDNNHEGYLRVKDAYESYEHRLNNAKERYRKRRALSWLLNHADFDKKLLEIYVEITDKGQWEGYISFDKKLVEALLLQGNHTHLEFTSKDLLEVWYKG